MTLRLQQWPQEVLELCGTILWPLPQCRPICMIGLCLLESFHVQASTLFGDWAPGKALARLYLRPTTSPSSPSHKSMAGVLQGDRNIIIWRCGFGAACRNFTVEYFALLRPPRHQHRFWQPWAWLSLRCVLARALGPPDSDPLCRVGIKTNERTWKYKINSKSGACYAI